MSKLQNVKKLIPLIFTLALVVLFGKHLGQLKEGIAGNEEGENQGFYKQWLESKISADGTLPKWMHAKWAAADRANLTRRSGEKIIDTVIELGPKSTGGRSRALWIDPRNENIVLAGSVSGGLWRSTNAGATWTPVNEHESSLSVTSIASNPFNHDIVYYSTGEGRGNSTTVDGGGIFKSIDGGKTFSVIASTVNKTGFEAVWKIAHSLDDSNTLFVGTESYGLFRSTDAGLTWQQVYNSGNGATSEILVLPNNRVIISRQGSSIVASDSSGKIGTFKAVTFPNPPGSGQYRRVQMANCRKYPQVIYALFEGYSASDYSDVPARFYKSSNFGKTWTARTIPTAIGSGQQGYCVMIGASLTDSNAVTAGAINLAKSTNGGTSWSNNPLYPVGHSDQQGFAAFSDGNYLVSNDGGIYKYKWTSTTAQANLNTGYKVTQFYAGNFGPTGLVSIGGTQDNGTHVTNGKLTSIKAYGGDGAYAHIGLQDGTIAYLSTQNDGIRRVEDFDPSVVPTFSTAIDDPAFANAVDFINAYTMNPADQLQLYYRTTSRIYRSKNGGDNWSEVARRSGIKALTTTTELDPILYFGGTAAQLYKLEKAGSIDIAGGYKEVNYNSTIPVEVTDDYLKCIAVHPNNKYTLFLSFSSFSSKGKIWKATRMDSAVPSYKNISGNLPVGLPVNSVAVDPAFPDKNLFAGTDFGLYFSTDSGVTWQKEYRIPNVAVFDIKMRTDRSLFVFTHGRGIFSLGLTGGASVGKKTHEIKSNTLLFPNPSQNILNIHLPENTQNIGYELYDMNAKLISKGNLVGAKNQISVAYIANGSYYLRLNGESLQSTHKILIQH